jgi:hypothetical protein
MEKNLVDVLLYFVPALLLIGAVFLVMKKFLERDAKVRAMELKHDALKQTLPLKLQAYERLIIFCERISPNNIILRLHRGGMIASQLHADLLSTIRAEFEHNFSQQIYISSHGWDAVKKAKEDMIKIVNIAFHEIGNNATAVQLSAQIFEVMTKTETFPYQEAIDVLKNEVKQMIG